jgi:hypothetical protein
MGGRLAKYKQPLTGKFILYSSLSEFQSHLKLSVKWVFFFNLTVDFPLGDTNALLRTQGSSVLRLQGQFCSAGS